MSAVSFRLQSSGIWRETVRPLRNCFIPQQLSSQPAWNLVLPAVSQTNKDWSSGFASNCSSTYFPARGSVKQWMTLLVKYQRPQWQIFVLYYSYHVNTGFWNHLCSGKGLGFPHPRAILSFFIYDLLKSGLSSVIEKYSCPLIESLFLSDIQNNHKNNLKSCFYCKHYKNIKNIIYTFYVTKVCICRLSVYSVLN